MSMGSFVKKISAQGIHGRFDVSIDFNPGVNILYGKNGSGKTTLLHILSNALNGDYKRFVFLRFKNIDIILNNGDKVSLKRTSSSKEEEVIVVLNDKLLHQYPVEKTKKVIMFQMREPRMQRRYPIDEDIEEYALISEETEFTEYAPLLEVAYFPAFRTMIDAWVSASKEIRFEYRMPERWYSLATLSARRWFGPFIPSVSYPSLMEIEFKLSDEINRARLAIGKADRELLTSAFIEIFESMSEAENPDIDNVKVILDDIKQLYQKLQQTSFQEGPRLVLKAYKKLEDNIKVLSSKGKVENTIIRILDVYRSVLRKLIQIQTEAYTDIQQYLQTVNSYLEGKQLYIDPTISRNRNLAVGIKFSDGDQLSGLRSLSSGERQIVALIYAASHMSNKEIALIDEPEISLHVDWQRRLLKSMSEQIGNSQIIVCTHSPVIAADYPERQVELKIE